MRKLNSLFGKLCAVALMALPVVFTSCNDDDEVINAPKIMKWELPNDTIVALGAGFTINPGLNMDNPVTYQWALNGESASTESSYTFQARDAGKFEIVFKATNVSGEDEKRITVHVRKYYASEDREKSFYILNEGWFGHENEAATVDYYTGGQWTTNYAHYEAKGSATGVYACISNDVFYLTAKDNARALIALDIHTFEEKGVVSIPSGQGRSFAVIDETTGILTTSAGAFVVNLSNMSLGTQLEQTTGECGDVAVTDKYIFVTNSKTKVYDVKTYGFVQELDTKMTIGFVKDKNGSLWGATSTALVKVNTQTLETTSVPTGVSVYQNSWAYTPCALAISPEGDTVYFGSGKNIYRYTIGSAESMSAAFAQQPSALSSYSFYGEGVSCNPKNGDIYAIYNKSWSQTNAIAVFDAKTGAAKETIDYTNPARYPFPSMLVFD